jgi:hypothetical protein
MPWPDLCSQCPSWRVFVELERPTQDDAGYQVPGACTAEVQVPSEILRPGSCFVDAPGIGSASEALRARQESTMPLR